jgi:RND family efflux transporter MFP subunit
MKIKPKDVSYTLQAIGSVEADEVSIYAKVSGIITKVNFKEGDFVEADKTILAEIDPVAYKLELAKAKAQISSALANFKKAKLDYRNRLVLYKKGYATLEELITYKTQVEISRANLKQAIALFKIAKKNYRDSKVTSPISGKIQTKNVWLGNYVRPDSLIATLIDTSSLKVRFTVPQSQARYLSINKKIYFTVSGIPNIIFSASIFHLSNFAHPQTRHVECLANKITIENKQTNTQNPDELLKAGYFANITIQTELHKNAIVIPYKAAVPTQKGYVVFTINDNKAHEKKVELGLYTSEGEVEIISGLQPEDIIVNKGSHIVKDGMEVEIIKED